MAIYLPHPPTHTTHPPTPHTHPHHTPTHTQLSALESTLQDTETRCAALETDLASSHAHEDLLTSQLEAATETLEDNKLSKTLLEKVGSERLSEITVLQRQLEEERVKEGMVRELGEQITCLESQLTGLQGKVSSYNVHLVSILIEASLQVRSSLCRKG